MQSTAALVEMGRRTGMPTYAPAPVVIAGGKGCWLWDSEGVRYLDGLAGIAVNTLGHAHPGLVAAIADQAARVMHVSNGFFTEPQVRLQDELARRSFADRVFLCNSGAEANEAAIKLARRFQREVQGTPRFEIITFEGSFHGRTMGALSATAQPKYHVGFEPLVPGFVHVPFGNLEAVAAAIGPHTAAILVEPIQGEGGIYVSPPGFLAGLRALCDAHGIVLVFDEVQCGMGRTGKLFAHQHEGVTPDLMTLAKGIGGGVPLGAMLATERLSAGFVRGSHATTYGGNPLTARAALAVLDAIDSERLCENASARGEQFLAGVRAMQATHSMIRDVRGQGLLCGIELGGRGDEAVRVVAAAREEGLLVNIAGSTVVRFVPPLIIAPDEVTLALARLDAAMTRVATSA